MSKKADRVKCQTPVAHCTGSITPMAPALLGLKTHSSHEEAFDCYVAYLKKIGYRQIGAHEFVLFEDQPVLVVSKRSRYGARLRLGKEGSRHMSGGVRNSGLIVG